MNALPPTPIVVTLAVLLIYFLTCCSAGLQEVCIVPDHGSRNLPSYCESNTTLVDFCRWASSWNANVSHTIATFLSGTHTLDEDCQLQDVSNVTLRGQSLRGQSVSKVPIHCKDCGFTFNNVSMLTLSDLDFVGCAGGYASLSFITGSDLALRNIKTVSIFITNVIGQISVNSSTFLNATQANVILFTSTIAGNASLVMANTVILNNRVPYSDAGGYSTTSGGLSLLLESHWALTVLIVNTTFRNNSGAFGGNLAIAVNNLASVTICNTTFDGGRASQGGGLYVMYHCSADLDIMSSIFTNNIAQDAGGGLYVVWNYVISSYNCSGNAYFNMTTTKFSNNSAGLSGLAVYAVKNSGIESLFKDGIGMSQCTFYSHSPVSITSSSHNSVIALTTNILEIDVESIAMQYNNCTAISAMGTTLYFSGASVISNNAAVSGGGIKLSTSVIFLMKYSSLLIANNSARQNGGGVLILDDPSCLSFDPYEEYTKCAIQSAFKRDFETSTVSITNNRAIEGGDNVYGRIDNCFDIDDGLLDMQPNTASQPSSISSDPLKICTYISALDTECNNISSTAIYPGQNFTVLVHLLGAYNGSISGTILADVTDAVIGVNEKEQGIPMSGGNITYTVFTKQRKISAATLILQPADYSCSELPVMATIDILFLDCPFGFENLETSRGFYCDCSHSSPVISYCDIDFQTIIKRKHSWLGMFEQNNHSYLATNDYCPLDYCKNSFLNIMSNEHSLSQDQQCQYNRTGVLCGSCPEGWSLVLGNSECRENCSSMWLFLILPFALAGLLLVVFTHFLNLTVTMGTVCGLIFYANIVQDYSITFLSTYSIPVLTPTLQVFLSWLNLDLGISTCFYDGMEAFGKTMFLFVFPIYIWLISVAIIFLSNRYIRFTRLVGENAMKILSTLILLSYSKMIRISISVLNVKVLNVYASSTLTKLRWAIDGTIPYCDPNRHLALFVIALLFLMLLLPFSVSLLCIKHIYSISNYCRAFSWIDKLKPFFDTYTGPYKDNARFWTGLLLFVRLILLIVNTMDYKDDVIPYYVVIVVIFCLAGLMIMLRGIYKRHYINVLDLFFLFNIFVLFLINTYQSVSDSWKSITSHVLVSSALLTFLGILAYHMYLKCSQLGLMRLRHQNADPDHLSFEGMRGYEPVQQLN